MCGEFFYDKKWDEGVVLMKYKSDVIYKLKVCQRIRISIVKYIAQKPSPVEREVVK